MPRGGELNTVTCEGGESDKRVRETDRAHVLTARIANCLAAIA
jgi:hypothetical protein